MLKDLTYKEKLNHLKNWIPYIVEGIKKDIKNEHLKKDVGFLKKYFGNKNPNKLTVEEMTEAYTKALAEEELAEQLAEFMVNRWLMHYSEIYYYFEQELRKINPDFEKIDLIDNQKAQPILTGSAQQFGAPDTYLFSILNSVAFSDETYNQLAQKAEAQHKQDIKNANDNAERQKSELTQRAFEEQIARITDKFEKKLLGLQKKYQIDVEALKKQIASLQRKLNEK